MIAVSGLDMAAWDAWPRRPACRWACFSAARSAPVPAYNSNGLWLTEPEAWRARPRSCVAEGGFTGLKLRLGRDRLADDLAAIARCARRSARTSS